MLFRGSAGHGGISRETTRSLMDRAQGRASAYSMRAIGAMLSGRWQVTQFSYRMGATSLANVGAASGAWASASPPPTPNATARTTAEMRIRMGNSSKLQPPHRRGRDRLEPVAP